MAQSNYTKGLRRNLWLFRILDWLCLFAPVIVYVCIALFGDGVVVGGRITVVFSIFIAIILSIFNVIAQKRLRCPIWIILIGLYVAIQEYLLPLIIILAVTTVLDDLIFTPLITNIHEKLSSSKVIDRRMGDNVREEI